MSRCELGRFEQNGVIVNPELGLEAERSQSLQTKTPGLRAMSKDRSALDGCLH